MSKPKTKAKIDQSHLANQERSIFIEQTRKRASHFISPEIAAVGDMTFQQMMQFSRGWYTPPNFDSIERLARRMSLA